jgi:hypothetical protein
MPEGSSGISAETKSSKRSSKRGQVHFSAARGRPLGLASTERCVSASIWCLKRSPLGFLLLGVLLQGGRFGESDSSVTS